MHLVVRMLDGMVVQFFMILFAAVHMHTTSTHTHLRGNHGKLGEQSDPSIETTELSEVPQPKYFYEQYVRENKPVVFRGAARKSSAFYQWTEDYLRDNYGNLTVRLEARFEDDARSPEGAVGLGMDLLKNYIDTYQSKDAYMITQIPEPMEKDIMILPCLRCGSFLKGIQETHIFLSAAGGKTALHKDPYNNIHCVFNGTKDWILIHPNQTEFVYMEPNSRFEWGGLSEINVDDIDLQIYPHIATVKYSKIRLYKGDCIFMPSGYWHQVRSFGYMNSAVSIWFSFLDKFDDTSCTDQVFDFTSMDQVPIIWRYSGFGNLTQGHMDIYILQKTLMLWADDNGIIQLRSFVDTFFVLLESNEEKPAMVHDKERRKEKFIQFLNDKGKGYTTTDIISKLSIAQLKELVEIIHPNDISNTDQFEYGHLDIEMIRKSILRSLKEDGHFDQDEFLTRYIEEVGGTEKKGKEILSALEIPPIGRTTINQLLSRMDTALQPYLNALTHDPATEKIIFQFLKTGKKMDVHDEL